ncbi:MAG: adenylosuccinate lyase [Sphaerochaeta sp.]|mgnify:CR=1 FL=1|jgi:adenylosuccinate lyase|uniref:adenylosuccinate lyase n=1 Tax=uncultured Sphaerochaeta sp. TaxID=886478 RepID=UPI000EBCE013|nr:adenylosuccinate lyase [uncultured Sphaerochaeta sp.]MCK9600074.1 adenylosuccinate lyase [Sphaerochaeta sp.]HCU30424.1 adenylosuccinate lyase [Sphaerochaeta sp.]
MQSFTHDTYLSPFSWRYGSQQMRTVFSEEHKRKLLRRIWVALAKAQSQANLVSAEQLDELVANQDTIDIERATEIEAEIGHDLMAEIKTYAEQCPKGGAVIHLGATSMDILDNMDAMRLKEALNLVIIQVKALLAVFITRMEAYADQPCMAFTHIQPAEPTTVGYRLAQTAQDLNEDLQDLIRVHASIRGKGMKGAVGTSASYTELLRGTGITASQLEAMVMKDLGLEAYTAATQVYTRKQDLRIGQALSSLCATLYKFFIDFRLLQSPPIGEWSEPFGSKQVGSSAMPFKRNPINSEKIDSLCRFVEAQESVLWQNAASTLLERTLDDSANRRLVLPELFLSVDEILSTAIKVVHGMQVHRAGIERNLASYGIFAASERLLMELGKNGANRQEMHELIREHSLCAWAEVQAGKPNTLKQMLCEDATIRAYLQKEAIEALLDANQYIGDSPERTRKVIEEIRDVLSR